MDEEIVFDYLLKQNRPYSAIDILNNLNKKVGKTAIGKSLDSLVAANRIREKIYGKQKVYLIKQDTLPAPSDDEISIIDDQIKTLSENCEVQRKACMSVENKAKELNNEMTCEQLEKGLVDFKQSIPAKIKKIASLKAMGDTVDREAKQLIVKRRETMIHQWRKRKRIANEMLDPILENYPKSKAELFEEIGIETDENAGVKIFST